MKSTAHTSVLARALVVALALLPLTALAKGGSGIPAIANVYTTVYDEQTGQGCTAIPGTVHDSVGFGPDTIPGASFAWDFFIGPWTAQTGLASGIYEDGTFPSSVSSAQRTEFLTNNKVFAIDTRQTAKPLRKFNLDFSIPYDPLVNVPRIGSSYKTAGLFQISGLQSLTSMAVCSSSDCPEWRAIKATFWFDETPDVQWRVDWAFVRVLRVSTNSWYIIGDACGGSQVAGLSELTGNRTKPREVNSGYFLMPLFIGVTLKQ